MSERHRICADCQAIVPMFTMASDGYSWWCRPCMDESFTRAWIAWSEGRD